MTDNHGITSPFPSLVYDLSSDETDSFMSAPDHLSCSSSCLDEPLFLSEETNQLFDELHTLGPSQFVTLYSTHGTQSPTQILTIFGMQLPSGLVFADEEAQWEHLKRILIKYVYVRPRNTLVCSNPLDVIRLLRESKNIMVITGAGISVSCGIPDFRSKGGLYDRIRIEYGMMGPEDMFDIHYFLQDPRPFYAFAKEALLTNGIKPSKSHEYIQRLEIEGRLLRNYTQNIDTLEKAAGITRVIHCHGSLDTSTCLSCGQLYSSDEFRKLLLNCSIPKCMKCFEGLIKPDIVFFGQPLPQIFDNCIEKDVHNVDLLLVIGSSMSVHPVSSIPDLIPPSIPQILINREPVDHCFDVELLGDCDEILEALFENDTNEWIQIGSFSYQLGKTTGSFR